MAADLRFVWTERVVAKLALYELSTDDIEDIVRDPEATTVSRSTGRPAAFGYTADGRYIFVVYEELGADFVRVRTAYPVDEP